MLQGVVVVVGHLMSALYCIKKLVPVEPLDEGHGEVVLSSEVKKNIALFFFWRVLFLSFHYLPISWGPCVS